MLAPASSWRAALRIARRDALRHKGRNLLVAIMVALPVLAVSAVDVLYRTSSLEPADRIAVELGTRAQALVRGVGSRVEQSTDGQQSSTVDDGTAASFASAASVPLEQIEQRLAALTSAGDRLVHTIEWFGAPRLRVSGRSIAASWWEVDLAEPELAGLYTTISGRSPAAAGEIAVSEALADHAGLHPGDTLDVPEAARSQAAAGGKARLSVVGVVRETADPAGEMIIGPTGTLLPEAERSLGASSGSWYVTGPVPVTWPDVMRFNAIGALVVSRAVLLDPPPADRVPFESHRGQYSGESGTGTLAAGVAVAIALALLQIALLAGPALAVGARRNQRMLAVVISTGGERRHARRIVLANAFLVGVAASLAGAVAGAGLGALAVVVLRSGGHLVSPSIDVSPLDLAILVTVGALTALAAALVPARQAARLDVVAALTGRRPAETIQRHIPVLGAVVAAAGIGLTLWGATTHRTVAVILGIGLGEIGLVGTTGAAVGLAALGSARLPLSLRMA
ncbi:MAG: FtsX-like permease family protein, partial [Kineosporiaceae bacterium]